MQIIRSIWAVLTNIIALVIFLGMLSIASSSFERVALSGLALIYVTVITYGVSIVRLIITNNYANANQYIQLFKLSAPPDRAWEANDLEENVKEEWESFQKKNPVYIINMIFVFIMWLIAVVVIIQSL